MKAISLILSLIFVTNSIAPSDIFKFDAPSIEEATAASQESQKPLLIYYTADWCTPCQFMNEYTFSDSYLVDQMNEEYITLQIDKDDEMSQELIDKYEICCLPTFQIIDPNKGVVSQIEGTLSTMNFYAFLGINFHDRKAMVAQSDLAKKTAIESGSKISIKENAKQISSDNKSIEIASNQTSSNKTFQSGKIEVTASTYKELQQKSVNPIGQSVKTSESAVTKSLNEEVSNAAEVVNQPKIEIEETSTFQSGKIEGTSENYRKIKEKSVKTIVMSSDASFESEDKAVMRDMSEVITADIPEEIVVKNDMSESISTKMSEEKVVKSEMSKTITAEIQEETSMESDISETITAEIPKKTMVENETVEPVTAEMFEETKVKSEMSASITDVELVNAQSDEESNAINIDESVAAEMLGILKSSTVANEVEMDPTEDELTMMKNSPKAKTITTDPEIPITNVSSTEEVTIIKYEKPVPDEIENSALTSTESEVVNENSAVLVDELTEEKSSITYTIRQEYLQAGAFKNITNAEGLRNKLSSDSEDVELITVIADHMNGDKKLFKVIVGPITTAEERKNKTLLLKKHGIIGFSIQK